MSSAAGTLTKIEQFCPARRRIGVSRRDTNKYYNGAAPCKTAQFWSASPLRYSSLSSADLQQAIDLPQFVLAADQLGKQILQPHATPSDSPADQVGSRAV